MLAVERLPTLLIVWFLVTLDKSISARTLHGGVASIIETRGAHIPANAELVTAKLMIYKVSSYSASL